MQVPVFGLESTGRFARRLSSFGNRSSKGFLFIFRSDTGNKEKPFSFKHPPLC